MNNKPAKAIAPLTKVKLALHLSDNSQQQSVDAPRHAFTFICGLGIEGLTGFEMELMDKKAGDCLTVPVDTHKAADYFEHLLAPLLKVVGTPPPFHLVVEIRDITAATERELVHALARKAEESRCGGGCSCGCSS